MRNRSYNINRAECRDRYITWSISTLHIKRIKQVNSVWSFDDAGIKCLINQSNDTNPSPSSLISCVVLNCLVLPITLFSKWTYNGKTCRFHENRHRLLSKIKVPSPYQEWGSFPFLVEGFHIYNVHYFIIWSIT